MKYACPIIRKLTSYASGWCEVGSGGENADNSCITGGSPTTQNCWTGTANQTGHCMGGSTVGNQGAALECMSGTSGSNGPGCGAGNRATGSSGCHTGTAACHCVNGRGA